MTKYAEAAQRLAELNEFLKRNSIPLPGTEFTGNIGEWRVMNQLIQRGYSPTLKSGQAPVDILLDDGRGVEVKSAILNKDRFGGAWLFDNIRPEKFDYLVCVKMSGDYSTAEFFVFTSNEANQIPYRSRSSDTRLLRIYKDIDRAPSEQGRRLNERLDEFLNDWQKLEVNV